MAMATALGTRIRELRERRDWTQGQLATYARVGRSWLSLVESGDRAHPNAPDLLRVARALGVSLEYLLTGDGASHDPEKDRLLEQMRPYPRSAIERALATLALWAGEFQLAQQPVHADPQRHPDEEAAPEHGRDP